MLSRLISTCAVSFLHKWQYICFMCPDGCLLPWSLQMVCELSQSLQITMTCTVGLLFLLMSYSHPSRSVNLAKENFPNLFLSRRRQCFGAFFAEKLCRSDACKGFASQRLCRLLLWFYFPGATQSRRFCFQKTKKESNDVVALPLAYFIEHPKGRLYHSFAFLRNEWLT